MPFYALQFTQLLAEIETLSQMCIYILLFIYISDDMNICYLLLITRCALILFLGWGLSTERVVAQPLHLPLFPQV